MHHVWTRGIDGLAIFHDDRVRRDFLTRIADAVAESDADWLGWALVSTHFHAPSLRGGGGVPLAPR